MTVTTTAPPPPPPAEPTATLSASATDVNTGDSVTLDYKFEHSTIGGGERGDVCVVEVVGEDQRQLGALGERLERVVAIGRSGWGDCMHGTAFGSVGEAGPGPR